MILIKIFAFYFSLVFAGNHPSVPNEFLVKMHPGVKGFGANFTEMKPLPALPNWYKVVSKKSLSAIAKMAEVEVVEPNYYIYAVKAPSDANYKYQWGMKNTGQKDNDGNPGQAGVDIDIERVWDLTIGDPNVVVAVIDTGIDSKHRDLTENMFVNEKELNGQPDVDDDNNGFVDDVSGYNFDMETPDAFDDHGHGTHCAGVIGARGNNDYGMAGVSWRVRLMPVKFLSKDGRGTTEGAIRSIIYAADNGARILSNSWGGGGESQALKDAIKYSFSKGALFVAAAGNYGENTDESPHFPSSYDVDNIVSVAALNNAGNLADFSNFGIKTVDIAAPGVNILSTLPGGVFEEWSGTSMATPFASGVAALMLSVNPALDAMALKARLLASARPMNVLKGKVLTGGLLNASGAVGMALGK